MTWHRLRLLLLVMGEQPALKSEPLPGRYDAWDVLEQRSLPPETRFANGVAFNELGGELAARALFRAFAEHKVEYIVVASFALYGHGVLRGTVDLDIVPRPDLTNLTRLGKALASVGARAHRGTGRVDVTDRHVLRRASLVALMTDHGRLDLLNVASTSGLPADYGELRDRALEIELDGIRLAIAGLDDLIRMKRAVGRDRDLADIRALAALDEDLAREAGEST